MGVLEKVALRKQKKLDRGEEIPDALEFIPGTKTFEDASASFGFVFPNISMTVEYFCANIHAAELVSLEMIS